jgi:hypothetical protein
LEAGGDKVTMLEALHMITGAWDDIKATTIAGCYKKAGII